MTIFIIGRFITNFVILSNFFQNLPIQKKRVPDLMLKKTCNMVFAYHRNSFCKKLLIKCEYATHRVQQ